MREDGLVGLALGRPQMALLDWSPGQHFEELATLEIFFAHCSRQRTNKAPIHCTIICWADTVRGQQMPDTGVRFGLSKALDAGSDARDQVVYLLHSHREGNTFEGCKGCLFE